MPNGTQGFSSWLCLPLWWLPCTRVGERTSGSHEQYGRPCLTWWDDGGASLSTLGLQTDLCHSFFRAAHTDQGNRSPKWGAFVVKEQPFINACTVKRHLIFCWHIPFTELFFPPKDPVHSHPHKNKSRGRKEKHAQWLSALYTSFIYPCEAGWGKKTQFPLFQ